MERADLCIQAASAWQDLVGSNYPSICSGEAMLRDLQLLRQWYLARLRKLALDDELCLSATPSTLMGADRRSIETMVSNSVSSRRSFSYVPSAHVRNVGLGGIILCVVVCILLYVS